MVKYCIVFLKVSCDVFLFILILCFILLEFFDINVLVFIVKYMNFFIMIWGNKYFFKNWKIDVSFVDVKYLVWFGCYI